MHVYVIELAYETVKQRLEREREHSKDTIRYDTMGYKGHLFDNNKNNYKSGENIVVEEKKRSFKPLRLFVEYNVICRLKKIYIYINFFVSIKFFWVRLSSQPTNHSFNSLNYMSIYRKIRENFLTISSRFLK